MSQDNKKSFVMYQGNGSNNVFSVPMTKGKYGTISVAFVRRGLDQYEYNPDTWGLNGGLFAWDLSGAKVYTDTATPAIGATIYDQYGVDIGDAVTAVGGATITVNTNVYTRDTLHDVDENTVLTWTGNTLQVGDYIVIERTTTRTQPFEFQNNQKHIEKSDDNLERQIQEVADKVDNALLVDPTHTIDSNKMNPVEWMKTILRSVDKSVRGFRYLNGWLDYSLDDPNIADVDKTWSHLVNTDNIKAIREQSRIENNETIYYTEYLAQDGSWKTLSDPHKWDNMKLSDLADTDFTNLSAGNFIMFDGLKWKNVYSSATASWGTLVGDITAQSDLMAKFTEYVRTDGTSIMTQPLLMRATDDFKCAIAPYWDGVGFFKLNNNNSVTLIASLEYQDSFAPAENNVYNIGSTSKKWKNLYLAGKAYMSVINNGYDIAVPVTNSADTLALLSDIAFKSTDVTITSPSNGQFLMYDGSKWINTTQGYANTDLSNLTDTGKNIGLWCNNAANIITEIPQDIKLELNNGTLTLKAGSKVYVPNGTNTFNTATVTEDRTTTVTGNEQALVYYSLSMNDLIIRYASKSVSGGTRSLTTTYMAWYDTANNVINDYHNNASTPRTTMSFPVALVTLGASGVESIDQVFNGFGYIGSTIFALPGVKGLIPDGRNADGTLKSTAIALSSVITRTFSSDYSGDYDAFLNSSVFGALKNSYSYDEANNRNKDGSSDYNSAYIGTMHITSGVVNQFNTKTTFHAVDYSDTEYIAHQAMPSDKYVDLTLGASEATYTMPDNGFLFLKINASAVGQYMRLAIYNNSTSGLYKTQKSATSSGYIADYIPVSKGDIVRVEYTLAGGNPVFRFFYANGAK